MVWAVRQQPAPSSQRTAHQAACEHLPAQPVGSSFRAFHLTVPSGSPGCTEADCKALAVKEGEPAALVPSMEMIRAHWIAISPGILHAFCLSCFSLYFSLDTSTFCFPPSHEGELPIPLLPVCLPQSPFIQELTHIKGHLIAFWVQQTCLHPSEAYWSMLLKPVLAACHRLCIILAHNCSLPEAPRNEGRQLPSLLFSRTTLCCGRGAALDKYQFSQTAPVQGNNHLQIARQQAPSLKGWF